MNAFKTGWLWLAGMLLAALPSSGQNYQVPWHNIGGGGGTRSGGLYSVSGSIGQPAASRSMVGGPFALTGGFVSGFMAVQQPGAPILAITAAGPNVVISWFPPASSFILQAAESLDGPAWMDLPGGTNQPVTMPVGDRMRYFRLRRP